MTQLQLQISDDGVWRRIWGAGQDCNRVAVEQKFNTDLI